MICLCTAPNAGMTTVGVKAIAAEDVRKERRSNVGAMGGDNSQLRIRTGLHVKLLKQIYRAVVALVEETVDRISLDARRWIDEQLSTVLAVAQRPIQPEFPCPLARLDPLRFAAEKVVLKVVETRLPS